MLFELIAGAYVRSIHQHGIHIRGSNTCLDEKPFGNGR